MRVTGSRSEEGFTLATTMLAMFLATLVVLATVTAVQGDIRGTERDLDNKRAYEAAQAGLGDYNFHLNSDNGYWAKCTGVPTPNAVNQMGSTAKRRAVPGTTGATYALELMPATGHSTCSTSDPVGSMIEQSGISTGTFRVRSTGYSGDAEVRIVASYKRASFLDYVYFTQLETSDPVTYGTEALVNQAYAQCTITVQQGRNLSFCTNIVFVTGETINGPLHTNDELLICGTPAFGRSPGDLIEVSAPPQGWRGSGGCSGNLPTFRGTFVTNAPVLTPPPTNGELANVPGAIEYSGQVEIELDGDDMNVTTAAGTSTVAVPASGVVYVSNGSGSCSAAYSPFTATYEDSYCGNVYVHGDYTEPLTIGAENDIIIDGNLERSGDGGMLGLIANNFIRVQHPLSDNEPSATCRDPSDNVVTNATGSLPDLRIDAAMLSIAHSFIVDHYNCGAPLGTLTVNGAISQKFRGAVGRVSGSTQINGYRKAYTYDDRLRYISPPHFLDPVESAWHTQRQTLDP